MKSIKILVNMYSESFFHLAPPQMLLAGALLLLLSVLTVNKSHRDTKLTRLVAGVAVLALLYAVGWILYKPQLHEKVIQLDPFIVDSSSNLIKPSARRNPNTYEKATNQMKSSTIQFGGRFENRESGGVANAEVRLNKALVAKTDEGGDFYFILPDQFKGLAFATLECRKFTETGIIKSSTELDLGHSDLSIRLFP